MAFTRNGDIVTQTGIDEGVAGLYDVVDSANKTRIILGSLRLYRITNTTIVQNGTWTINANTDQLYMNFETGGNRALTVNGTLNLDSRFTFNGYERVEQVLPLVINTQQVTFTGCVIVGTGGRINQRCPIMFFGGTVSTNGALMIFENGAYHFVRNGSARMIGGTGTNKQIRYRTGSSFDADGFNLSGLNFTFEDVNYVNTNRMSVDSVAGFGMVFSSIYSFDEVLVFKGFDFNAVDTIEYKNVTGTIPTRHEDPIKPVDDYVTFRQTKSENEQTDFTSTVKFNAIDTGGNAIDNARAVIIDEPTTAGNIFVGYALEYSAGTAQNQILENDETHSIIRSTNTNAGFFHRGKGGSADLFDFRVRSPFHLDQNGTIDLSAEGEKPLATTLLENQSVTESDLATIEAYSIANTPRNFYDYDRADRAIDLLSNRNITIDLDTETIDYGDMDVVVSGAPTPPGRPVVYNDDNTQATLYVGDTGVFTGNIRTTGFIELSEGATVDGSTKSSRGTTIKLSGFPSGREGVAVAWPQSEGIDNAFTTTHAAISNDQVELLLENNTAYYIRVDCIGYRRKVFTIDTTTQTSLVVNLDEYGTNNDGVFTPILPDTLTAEQQAIADMFSSMPYADNNENTHIIITLPNDYTSDAERWDHASETFTFLAKDFIPIAYKIKLLLQSENLLENQYTIDLEESDIIFESNFDSAAFCQSADNVNGIEINFGGFSMRRVGDDLQVNSFIDRSRGNIRVRAIQPSASLPALATIQTTLEEVKTSVVDDRSEIIKPTQDEFNQYMDNTTLEIQDKYKGEGGGSGGASATEIVTAIRDDNIAKGLVEEDGTGADRFSAKALEQAPSESLTTDQSTKLDSIETSVVTNRAELEKPTQDEFNERMDNTTEAIQDKFKATSTGDAGLTTEQEQKLDDLKTGQTEIKNGQLN